MISYCSSHNKGVSMTDDCILNWYPRIKESTPNEWNTCWFQFRNRKSQAHVATACHTFCAAPFFRWWSGAKSEVFQVLKLMKKAGHEFWGCFEGTLGLSTPTTFDRFLISARGLKSKWWWQHVDSLGPCTDAFPFSLVVVATLGFVESNWCYPEDFQMPSCKINARFMFWSCFCNQKRDVWQGREDTWRRFARSLAQHTAVGPGSKSSKQNQNACGIYCSCHPKTQHLDPSITWFKDISWCNVI